MLSCSYKEKFIGIILFLCFNRRCTMVLYENIRKRRKELGLSQKELADKLGYKSTSTIAKIENGTNDIPQSKIVAFAKALDTTPGKLMGLNTGIISVAPPTIFRGIDGITQNEEPTEPQGYYINPETAALAQELHDKPELRILMDASRDLSPEDVKFVAEMVQRMKKKERGDID